MSQGYNTKQIKGYSRNLCIQQNIFKYIRNSLEVLFSLILSVTSIVIALFEINASAWLTMLSTGTLYIPDDIMQIP